MRRPLYDLVVAVMLVCAPGPACPAKAQAAPIEVRILAINDFHGNLRPPTGGIRIADPEDKTKSIEVAAGGVEPLVKQLRGQVTNTIFVAAGD